MTNPSKILESTSSPFSYFIGKNVFPYSYADHLLNWVENCEHWNLAEESFYEQYEFNFKNRSVILSKELETLFKNGFLSKLKTICEEGFETELERQVSICAHKLVKGQGIGIHTDSMEGEETHRLVVFLNRKVIDENGGQLVFFNSQSPQDIHRIIRPTHNIGVGFKLAPNAYHAVAEVQDEDRITIIFSFWEKIGSSLISPGRQNESRLWRF